MADFCKQCTLEVFGSRIHNDFEGMCDEDEIISALCEHCGITWVSNTGECIGPCFNPDHYEYGVDLIDTWEQPYVFIPDSINMVYV